MHESMTAGAILGLALASHMAIWRLRRPSRDTAALLLVAGASLTAILVATVTGRWPCAPQALAGWIQVVFAVAAVWLAYCELYLAIKNESPSSRMLLYAARHPGGSSEADLLAVVANGPLEDERLESLVNGGLVQRTAKGLEPTTAGRRLAAAINAVCQLYRLSPPLPTERVT
jgi:hypothetical protein